MHFMLIQGNDCQIRKLFVALIKSASFRDLTDCTIRKAIKWNRIRGTYVSSKNQNSSYRGKF